MLVFSLSSPIGIAIGMIISSFSADSNGMDIAVAVLESISTGTFLFVVFIGSFQTNGPCGCVREYLIFEMS